MYNLCCISNDLKAKDISFKTMTWKRFTQLSAESREKALQELGAKWLNNVLVTRQTIEHCYYNGWGYRVSSSLFPVLTHPEFEYDMQDVPQYAEIQRELISIANANRAWRVRLSTHPDQFNVLASENQAAVSKTIHELDHHGWVLDKLGCERSRENPINIHVNCTKGSLKDIAQRFAENLAKCDESVTTRLTVETEDKGCWNAETLCEHFDVPVCFDNLHNQCNPAESLSEYEAAKLCKSTWKGVRPLFHLSESHPTKGNPRSHADLPTVYPWVAADIQADWDVEFKGKDDAIRELSSLRSYTKRKYYEQ